MSTGFPMRARVLAGSLLLAFWLGWVAIALANMQPSWRGDPQAARQALETVLARLPAEAGDGPLAVRLRPGCACAAGAVDAWQALAAGLHAGGGRAITVDAGPGAFEVVILAPGRRLVYAGPLVPDPALCGGGHASTRLRQWLPQLLRAGTPLVAAAACPCHPSSVPERIPEP